MKKNVKALAALFLASFAFLVTACKTEVATDTTPPAKVTDVNATAANGKAVITWTNPADEDFYATRITVAPSVENGNSSLVIEGSANDKSSASFDGLVNGTEYTFKLYSLDNSHNDSEAVEVKATPKDTSDKTAPADVSDLTVNAANGNAVLTWMNPTDSDFAGVKITMMPAAGTLANPVTLDKGVDTFTVSGLTNGEEYSFNVQSFDNSLNFAEGATVAATPEYTSDTTAPASVTNLVASAKDKSVLLTWTDAVDTDNDIYGYEVSWTSETASRAVTALEANSMVVAQGVCGAIVRNLTNGTEYTFTVKTLDTSFNKSDVVTATATPVENPSTDVLKIELSVPDTKSNTSVTVTANITTAGTVKKVVYKKDGSINPAKLLADSDAIGATVDESDNTKWTFTISATDESINGTTYTVAAIDSDGREEIEQITINNFDFTPPAKPKVTSGVYSSELSSIILNWTNPTDSDFDHVEICYTTNDGTKTSEKSSIETSYSTNKTYSNIDATKAYYIFYLVSVDKLGNKGNEKSCAVVVNKGSIKIPVGFVQVPAATITGSESWTPSSSVFVSGRNFTIDSFYMCDHEVTQDEYKTVMGTNPSTATADGTADDNPVNYVNWYHAIAYCNKLSAQEGLTPCYTVTGITDWANLAYSSVPTSSDSTWNAATCDFTADGYRLPTEAEWEWAARGGENYSYAGSNTIDDVAWYSSNSSSKTHEVKTKNANGYGLYDMSGNVWEWCWDWYGSISSGTDATGPASGSSRVYRGGSWYLSASRCTVSYRNGSNPCSRSYYIGFRVVRSKN